MDPDEICDAVADFGQEHFLHAKPDVEALLDHPDPLVRYNALGALGYNWASTDRVDKILEILGNDPDGDCRRRAASVLGCIFSNLNNRAIAKLLGQVVLNDEEEDDVRVTAYLALLNVFGLYRTLYRPNMTLKDIDWELIMSFSEEPTN
jgi:HEAT repeat protein